MYIPKLEGPQAEAYTNLLDNPALALWRRGCIEKLGISWQCISLKLNMHVPVFIVIISYTLYVFEIQVYIQTCIKRSYFEWRKGGLIRQVTSYKRLNSYEIIDNKTRKGWHFNTGDCMGRFDCTFKLYTLYKMLQVFLISVQELN